MSRQPWLAPRVRRFRGAQGPRSLHLDVDKTDEETEKYRTVIKLRETGLPRHLPSICVLNFHLPL